MDKFRYQDEHGFWVEIGTIVGFTEFFTNHQIDPQDAAECYKVVGLPNLGDMVQMLPGHLIEGEFVPLVDEADDSDNAVLIVPPYMIGAI